jgi:putative oligomerization/nucleic acid binding protein
MLLKKILMVVCLLVAIKASAQSDIIIRGDTLILPNGAKYWRGEQVTIGTGSNMDKTFNFIYIPEVLHLIKKHALAANYAGRTATIKKFQKDGAYKNGYSYNILVIDFGEPRNYWCDVQGALVSNELVNTSKGSKDSKEAKLARLKKLLDSGDITQDEYNTLKNKILNNNDTNTDPNPKKDNSKPIVF